MKKRIVFPLFLLLLAGGTAAAQNWQEALKQAATAVGVFSERAATISTTLWSLSCPNPAITGSGNCAIWKLSR